MESKKLNLDSKLNGFIGFIPKPLKVENKPELAIFPLNVLIGRYTVKERKNVLGSVLYEPDLSSLAVDKKENLVMNYYNRYDRRHYLKMIIEKGNKSRRCEKYFELESIGITMGEIDWEKPGASWNVFFNMLLF